MSEPYISTTDESNQLDGWQCIATRNQSSPPSTIPTLCLSTYFYLYPLLRILRKDLHRSQPQLPAIFNVLRFYFDARHLLSSTLNVCIMWFKQDVVAFLALPGKKQEFMYQSTSSKRLPAPLNPPISLRRARLQAIGLGERTSLKIRVSTLLGNFEHSPFLKTMVQSLILLGLLVRSTLG